MMKIFNKGQVVIPADIRKALNIHPGDMLDVVIDKDGKYIKISKPDNLKSETLAGSFSKYKKNKKFPKKAEMRLSLVEGLLRG